MFLPRLNRRELHIEPGRAFAQLVDFGLLILGYGFERWQSTANLLCEEIYFAEYRGSASRAFDPDRDQFLIDVLCLCAVNLLFERLRIGMEPVDCFAGGGSYVLKATLQSKTAAGGAIVSTSNSTDTIPRYPAQESDNTTADTSPEIRATTTTRAVAHRT